MWKKQLIKPINNIFWVQFLVSVTMWIPPRWTEAVSWKSVGSSAGEDDNPCPVWGVFMLVNAAFVKGHGPGRHVCRINMNNFLDCRFAWSPEINSLQTNPSAAAWPHKKHYKYLTWLASALPDQSVPILYFKGPIFCLFSDIYLSPPRLTASCLLLKPMLCFGHRLLVENIANVGLMSSVCHIFFFFFVNLTFLEWVEWRGTITFCMSVFGRRAAACTQLIPEQGGVCGDRVQQRESLIRSWQVYGRAGWRLPI